MIGYLEHHCVMSILGVLGSCELSVTLGGKLQQVKIENTGAYRRDAVDEIIRLFKKFEADIGLPLYYLSESQQDISRDGLLERLSGFEHGDYIGLAVGWREHGFAFHMLKDKDEYYILYSNTGEKALNPYEDQGDSTPVPVGDDIQLFEFNNNSKDVFLEYVKQVHDISCLPEEARKHQFECLIYSLNKNIRRNSDLESSMSKSHQKGINCAFSTIQSAQHFSLVSNWMKEKQGSIGDGYHATLTRFKTLRALQRADAVLRFLQNKSQYVRGHENILWQILLKMSVKTQKCEAGQKPINQIKILIDYFQEQAPELIKLIIDELSSNPLEKEPRPKMMIDGLAECINQYYDCTKEIWLRYCMQSQLQRYADSSMPLSGNSPPPRRWPSGGGVSVSTPFAASEGVGQQSTERKQLQAHSPCSVM